MLIKNTKYKPIKSICKVQPIHRKGDRLFVASIEKTNKKANPIDFVAIPVKILSTQVTTFYEECKTVILYDVENLNNNEVFFIEEERLFLSMKQAYTAISDYLDNVINIIEDKVIQEEKLNQILIEQQIEPIGKHLLRKKLLNYLKGRQFQAIITAENLDQSKK